MSHVIGDLNAANQLIVTTAVAAYNACAGSGAPNLFFVCSGLSTLDAAVFRAMFDVSAFGTGYMFASLKGDYPAGTAWPLAVAYTPSGGNQSTLATNLQAALVAYFATKEGLA